MTRITRRHWLAMSAAATCATPAHSQPAPLPRGMVIDALCEPGGVRAVQSLMLVAGTERGSDYSLAASDIADIRRSGLTAINATVSAVGAHASAFEETLRNMSWFEREISANPDTLMKVLTARDLATAKRERRLGIIYGFQDTYLLGPTFEHLAMFDRLGVRIVQLTYNRRNLSGDGSQEPANAGLSQLGRALISELNERRMLIDLSHGGATTIRDAIETSSAPVAITHTGCRALVDVARNVGDAELRALADRGGVVGIYFMPFLRRAGQPQAEDLIAHIEHALNVCGEDHVGIGTDGAVSGQQMDAEARAQQRAFVDARRQRGVAGAGEDPEVFNLVPQYNDAQRYRSLARDLTARGHRARRVEKILGDNFARLFADVWR